MFKNQNFLILFLSLGLIVALPTASLARRGGADGPDHSAMKKLGLSDEQKAKMKELRESAKSQRKSLREATKSARKKLDDLMNSDAAESALQSAHQAVQKARTTMADFRFKHQMSVRKILTSEQRKKWIKSRQGKHRRKKMRRRSHKKGSDSE